MSAGHVLYVCGLDDRRCVVLASCVVLAWLAEFSGRCTGGGNRFSDSFVFTHFRQVVVGRHVWRDSPLYR